jgi:hypothetical protein
MVRHIKISPQVMMTSQESSQSSMKVAAKATRPEWQHFMPEALDKNGKVVKVKCKYCTWTASANASRIAKHFHRHHGKLLAGIEAEAEATEVNTEVSVKRQRTEAPIARFLDKLPDARRRLADEKLSILQLKFGLSLSALTSDEMRHFCAVLSAGYRVPSRPTLQERGKEIYAKLRSRVNELMAKAKIVCFSTDCWEDSASCAVLGIIAHILTMNVKPVFLGMKRLTTRSTAENLAAELQSYRQMLEDVGCKVVACQADNGANVQAAIKQLTGILPLRCMAHCANLLIKDITPLWQNLLSKTETLERFFRGHYPRVVYLQTMERNIKLLELQRSSEGHSEVNPPRPTILKRPVATRWASQLACLRLSVSYLFPHSFHCLALSGAWSRIKIPSKEHSTNCVERTFEMKTGTAWDGSGGLIIGRS